MPDQIQFKLGKKPPKIDTRTLKLAKYLTPELAPPPVRCDWTKNVTKWGMMANDRLGDCTIAAVAHAIQVATVNNGSIVTVPDDVVVKYYEQWAGYVPGKPNTDNGAYVLDVMNHWRKEGFAGHKLLAYMGINPGNMYHVQQAIALFGGIYIGVALPYTAVGQQEWLPATGNLDSPQASKWSWGGHAVYVPAYDIREDRVTCITWGGLLKMDWQFWASYCDEAYVLVMEDWLKDGKTPVGIDLDTLMKDLEIVTR